MPRAKNDTVGPEADALDAAALARDQAEEAANRARLVLLTAAVLAIDAGMSIAEAARRAGYTREHLSKLYASAKDTTTQTRPRKTAREVFAAAKAARPAHKPPAE